MRLGLRLPGICARAPSSSIVSTTSPGLSCNDCADLFAVFPLEVWSSRYNLMPHNRIIGRLKGLPQQQLICNDQLGSQNLGSQQAKTHFVTVVHSPLGLIGVRVLLLFEIVQLQNRYQSTFEALYFKAN